MGPLEPDKSVETNCSESLGNVLLLELPLLKYRTDSHLGCARSMHCVVRIFRVKNSSNSRQNKWKFSLFLKITRVTVGRKHLS